MVGKIRRKRVDATCKKGKGRGRRGKENGRRTSSTQTEALANDRGQNHLDGRGKRSNTGKGKRLQ